MNLEELFYLIGGILYDRPALAEAPVGIEYDHLRAVYITRHPHNDQDVHVVFDSDNSEMGLRGAHDVLWNALEEN